MMHVERLLFCYHEPMREVISVSQSGEIGYSFVIMN